MRLCLDEHYSPQIAVELRALEHDVASVKERVDLVGASDADLFLAMTVEHRALLTENVSDFAPLARHASASGAFHYGLIFSAPASMPRSKNTIGLFVDRLRDVLERHPRETDFSNKVEWL